MNVTALPDTSIPLAPPRMSAPTRQLLEGPILSTLLRMAAPTVLVMLVQASTGLMETYFIGQLGTSALAGVSLVFPGVMLMTMMSAGAMGGGIASSIARALGAGRQADADALVFHAVLVSALFGVAFTAVAFVFGPPLYLALGGEGDSLRAALRYSNIIFGGAVLVWVFNGLSAAIRGTGNMVFPALVTIGSAVVLIPLSRCLIFGLAGFPAFGVAGGGIALLIYYGFGSLVFAGFLLRPASLVRLSVSRPRGDLFGDILRVGLIAAVITVTTNLTVAMTTGFVGRFGTAAIAGYGTGSRLEYMLVPLVFGFGAPLVAFVGTNIGAGQPSRAVRVAWIGAACATVMTEAIGLAAAAWPVSWLGLFGDDPAMLAQGATYLRIVGPFYGFFGCGMALYFSAQGAGRLHWPLIAGILRVVVAVAGGWLALRLTNDLRAVFLVLGVALLVMGMVNAIAVARGVWFRGHA